MIRYSVINHGDVDPRVVQIQTRLGLVRTELPFDFDNGRKEMVLLVPESENIKNKLQIFAIKKSKA